MAVFADTFFYVALLNPADESHAAVVAYIDQFQDMVVTSQWVLIETANALSRTRNRERAAKLLRRLESHPAVKLIGATDEYYRRGVDLYAARLDKEWSLTDCISFCIMKDEGLTEALTRDHHFAQAGFTPLFADLQ